MNNNTVKAVLFDLDNTLFDHRHASLNAIGAIREDYTVFAAKPLQELQREANRLLEEIFEGVLAGTLTVEDARVERFRRLVSWCDGKPSPDDAAEMAARYREEYQKARRPVPGAVSLLRHLRSEVVVGVVTDNFTAEQRDEIACCGLEDYIDFLVTFEEVGSTKRETEIFEAALRKAGCRADEAVMVGDNWSVDVVGARAAGIRAVWLNRDGLPNLDPDLAAEISSFDPPEPVLRILLNP
ncbi:MAG: HAD family hydrolase [Rubrobacteraceae bacterium]